MLQFTKIKDEMFPKYKSYIMKEYVKELMDNGLSRLDAESKCEEEVDALLKDGYNSSASFIMVIQVDGKNVGTMWYSLLLDDPTVAFICDFMILEKYRGKGYGKESLLQLEKEAMLKNCLKIRLSVFKTNTYAHALYSKMGYKETVETYDSFIMEKEI